MITLSVSFKSLEVPWECPINVQMYGFFCFELLQLSCQQCLLYWLCAMHWAIFWHLTVTPQLHYLIAVSCISNQSCMGSWVSAFRLEHQAVLLLMNVCYISISLCLEQPHLLRSRAFKAQNKIGWKLLGGSMLLELYVDLFWRNSCIFWMEEEVWFAGLWGVRFVRHAFLKQFPDPQSRIKCGHPPNF